MNDQHPTIAFEGTLDQLFAEERRILSQLGRDALPQT